MTRHDTSATTRSARPQHAGGFTLIELIVAIGAVALIAVGIAAIFDSIGRTVAGGRRVNQLNQYAALIERQMRSDFEAMTRDGVLVIKHDYADADGDGSIDFSNNSRDRILNSATQRADEGRLRRIDQILFFVRGEFTSARTPMVPGLNAAANEGMVVYGHGIRLDPVEDVVGRNIGGGAIRYDRPQLNNGGVLNPFEPERALGYTSTAYPTNPNRFAENWTLTRRLTLLAQPNSSDLNLPEPGDPFWNDLKLDRVVALDSDVQVGGQPAAPTAFSHLNRNDFFPPNAPFIRGFKGGDQPRSPALSSGLVDIASTDLAEIRRVIMDVGNFPWQIDETAFDPTNGNYLFDDQYNASLALNDLNNNLLHMHAWMADLFPVITDPRSPYANSRGVRTHYEDVIPDYVGTLSTYTDQRTRNYPFIQNFRLGDQRMLSSGVFVPRCTEFIIEYSFGEVVSDDSSPFYGQLVWHGLSRAVQKSENTGTTAQPYPFWQDPSTSDNHAFPYSQPYLNLDGTPGFRGLSTALLYGRTGNQAAFNNAESLTAYFGYTDPTYSPTNPDIDPATVPWPWPKLIRVTMTLADPIDPAIEQTFQFVFETPEGRAY